MRGVKAKAMRRYVKERFPFLSASPLYRIGRYGTVQVVLAEQCQRSMYKLVKKAYKEARRSNRKTWRNYNDQRSAT